MLKQCVILAVCGYVLGAPQQLIQGEIPPHLVRQYLAQQQQAQQYTPSAQATQVLTRPTHAQQAVPARLPYAVQPETQYQPAPVQYRPQYQTQAQYQRPQQQQEKRDPQEDYDPHPQYQFGFDVNDDQYTNYQNRKEERDGDVIKGSYSVVDSDGFIRTVTYTADPKEGFKAEVSRQPTDIVVKIPTPKPQLAQIQHQHQPQHQHQHQPQQQHQHQQQQQSPQQYYRYQQQ